MEKITKAAIPKNRIWFKIKRTEITKPSKQIKNSTKFLKILNKYDFFSSLVFCFNAFINFLEIKKTATKIATIKTTNEYKFGDFTAKYHKGKTTTKPKAPQINASKRIFPKEIKNDKKPLNTESVITKKNTSPKTTNHF